MAGMARNGWKWLERAGIAILKNWLEGMYMTGNGLKRMEMAGHFWKGWKWLEMALKNAGNGWKWLE